MGAMRPGQPQNWGHRSFGYGWVQRLANEQMSLERNRRKLTPNSRFEPRGQGGACQDVLAAQPRDSAESYCRLPVLRLKVVDTAGD